MLNIQDCPKDFLLDSYDYHLPEELIAQDPLDKRDDSRMMVLHKNKHFEHSEISQLPRFLAPGDCLVVNESKVIPARIFGHLPYSEAMIECLLIREVKKDTWRCLAKPGRKLKVGRRIIFKKDFLEAEVIDVEADGSRLLQFFYQGIWEEVLAELGEMPLPPYIHHVLKDHNRYQTVYAKHSGSVAAPTAGLHFTEELLASVKAKGITVAPLSLHVGIGTFRPVKEENILAHTMHSEVYELPSESARLINECKKNRGRIVCVGTTSCRTLESIADERTGLVKPCLGETDIFIYPGYRFKIMDTLLTNFHLPKSSLLMLVSAFYGRENILSAYKEAISEKYRFYSFGDCMLIEGEKDYVSF